jgi:phage terminase large subunit-like protein
MPRGRTTDNNEYRNNRTALLKGQPLCHWCHKKTADTADHLIEVDRGGDNSLSNLVPACRECNSRRGNQYKNARDRQRIHDRAEATRTPINSEKVFYDDQPLPPSPSFFFSPNSDDQPELALTGHDHPRLATISPDQQGSHIDGVVEWARKFMQIELMEWQINALRDQLAFSDDAGIELVTRTSLVSVARQCGKSVALRALCGWWLTEMPKIRGEKQTVLMMAHRLDVAAGLYEEIADVLEMYFDAKLTRSYGRLAAKLPDGSKLLVRSAKPSAAHSLSVDLALIDEVWGIEEEVIDGGVIPTMRARKNPLLSMWSTAGTEDSKVMMRYREMGLRLIDTHQPTNFHFREWSPPPDLDPMDPSAWAYANPALGKTLQMSTIESEAQLPDRASFLRASVNLWIATDRSWLPQGLWSQLATSEPLPAGGVVAVEVDFNDSHYYATRSVLMPDGKIGVTVAFTCDTQSQLWEHIQQIAKDPSIQFALTPTVDLQCPPSIERRRVVVGYAEILKWTPAIQALIRERQLVHTGEMALAEHVVRAVSVRTQGSIAVSSQRSPGPIELCRTMIFSSAIVAGNRHSRGKPQLVVVAN